MNVSMSLQAPGYALAAMVALWAVASCASHKQPALGPEMEHYKAELDKMHMEILQSRNDLVTKVFNVYGHRSPQADSARKSLTVFDSLLTQRFIELEAQYGFPLKSKIGASASAASLVIAHSDQTVLDKYLVKFIAAAETGNADWYNVSALVDRSLLYKNMPQLYGAQYTFKRINADSSVRYIYAMDYEKLRKRRREVGLERLPRRRWEVISDTLFLVKPKPKK